MDNSIEVMDHADFVRAWKAGDLLVDVSRPKALAVVDTALMPMRYRAAHMFWSWLWFLSIPGAFVVMFLWKWWVGVLLLLFVTPTISKAVKHSAMEFMIDHALEDPEFYRLAVDQGLIRVRRKASATQATRPMQPRQTPQQQTRPAQLSPAEDVARWKHKLADFKVDKGSSTEFAPDQLTGFRSERELARQMNVIDAAGSEPTSLIVLNLDRFQALNAGLGRAAGDAALRHFASVLEMQIHGSELVCRTGGDEFTVLARGAHLSDALELAERIRRATETAAWFWNGFSYPLTVSCGVAAYPDSANRIDKLPAVAKSALSIAKAEGRNHVRQAIPNRNHSA
jgi:diguanylate cyclase (GGDEF)-like protein